MAGKLSQFIYEHRPAIEAALEEHLPLSGLSGSADFNEAVRYAVFPGGKRWRPVLTLLSAAVVNGDVRRAFPAAVAMEYLHTSSLILDDLPAMDDADVRRGRSSLHVAYGEGTALLVALALLNQAYALLLKAGAMDLIAEATQCIGANGMIGGQAADLECCPELSGVAGLQSRNLKTTALTRLMMTAGAIAAGASAGQVRALAKYGECLGAAYQICDDLLDEIGDSYQIGKPSRQDQRHFRQNFASMYGVEGAEKIVSELIGEAVGALLSEFGERQEVSLLAEAAGLITGKVKLESLATAS
jgi:geranylgeranyl diphosphate synthase type II